MEWALAQRPRVLFLPDQHLGRNTARKLGIPAEQVVLYARHEPDGGLTDDQIRQAKVILWQGHCHVHTYFRPEMIEARHVWRYTRIWRSSTSSDCLISPPNCVP